MTSKLILFILIVYSGSAFGQTISFSYHGQRHDMRAVPYIPYTIKWTDHVFGVSTYQLSYNQKISKCIGLGLGFGYELSKTTTGLNPDLLNLNYLPLVDRYRKFLVLVPVEFNYPLRNGFSVGLQILTSVGFNRSFLFTRNLDRPNPTYSLKNFFLNDFEFISHIEYKYKKISFRAGYRMFHVKRVDDAIFFKEYFDMVSTLKDTDVYNKVVDMYNPFKLVFSIGYSFKYGSQ
ncbi:MAG: hypothetical protein IPL20_04935 [Saprospiraceae bacterium]|nr:hypothetical protein [Saprospiraceae bacterium]